MKNQWDILSEFFNVRTTGGKIEGGAMDNILVAWPPILKIINKNFPKPLGKKALDYGCGVGEFCYKLNSLGFDVVGIDSSRKMINKTKKILPSKVETIFGNHEKLKNYKFNLITAIQVFQFVENFE